MTSIQDLLKQATIKAPEQKPFPKAGPNGEPHIPEDIEPGAEVPAGTLQLQHSEVPGRGERCSVSRCKEQPQYVMTNLGTRDPSVQFEQPDLTRALSGDQGLVANINALMASIHAEPARQVPEKTIRLCFKHHLEFVDARNAQITADREARTPKSWPLHDLNPEGATVDFDGEWITITESPEHSGGLHPGGRSIRLEMYRAREVQAWRNKKRYHNRVLSPEDIAKVKKIARLELGMTMAEVDALAQVEAVAQADAITAQAEAISKAQQAEHSYGGY